MAENVKLPKGVTVYQGGRKFEGTIPVENCPQKLRPATQKKPATYDKSK